jgi:hypothetical protein
MTTTGTSSEVCRQVDEGWGRNAATFASLAELSSCREYVALHHHLGPTGCLARKPAPSRRPRPPAEPSRSGFVAEPEPSPDVERLYAEDVEDQGYVMNGTRTWAHPPVLISAMASTMGDSRCSLAWGGRLADRSSPELAASLPTEVRAAVTFGRPVGTAR